jgi:hypothetical protein
MDAQLELSPTSVGDLEPGVSRQTLDGTTQDSTHQAKQSSKTPAIVQSSDTPGENSLDSSTESTPFSQAQIEERPPDSETISGEGNPTNTTSNLPQTPKPEYPYPTNRGRLPMMNDPYPFAPASSLPRPPLAEARIMRMGNTEFDQKRTSCAIEVLLEEPMFTMRLRQKSRSFRDLTLQSTDPSQVQPITKPNPRKIRIRSPIILNLLGEVAKLRGHSFFAMNPNYPDIYNPTVSEWMILQS